MLKTDLPPLSLIHFKQNPQPIVHAEFAYICTCASQTERILEQYFSSSLSELKPNSQLKSSRPPFPLNSLQMWTFFGLCASIHFPSKVEVDQKAYC